MTAARKLQPLPARKPAAKKTRASKLGPKPTRTRPTELAARRRAEAQRRFVQAYEAEHGEITDEELAAIRAEWRD